MIGEVSRSRGTDQKTRKLALWLSLFVIGRRTKVTQQEVYGLSNLLTFNEKDFSRYTAVRPILPSGVS